MSANGYGSVVEGRAGEASASPSVDEERGTSNVKITTSELKIIRRSKDGSSSSPKTTHLSVIFVLSVAIIGVVLFLVLADVWGMGFRRGDDDDDDGGDGDGEPDCMINDPRTSNVRYTSTLTKIELDLT
eukprot:5019152-Pyramimonas_sp.AAC.1